MAQWVVKLVGHEFDLKALSKIHTAAECRVAQDSDDAYYLTSEEFASMAEGSDVHDTANNMLLLINDLMRARAPEFQSVSLADVTRINDDGTRSTYVFLSEHITSSARMSVDATVLDASGQLVPSPEPGIAQNRLKLALRDAKIREALVYWRRCNPGDADVCQYANKVYEVIREDMASGGHAGQGADAIKQKKWAVQGEIDNFQAWANSPAISGQKARHADRRPAKSGITPLSDGEALAFIQRLLNHWLDWKAAQRP